MRVRRRIDAGCVCEIEIYNAAGAAQAARRVKRLRFRDEAERAEHRDRIGRQAFARMIHANYVAGRSLYSTLTFRDEDEVYSMTDAKRARANYARRLRRAYPEARFVIVLGRGTKRMRIHMHMISDGIPAGDLARIWGEGLVESAPLRAHNLYGGIDHGPDWTALALYLWRHWTPEQGGHHYYATRNHRAPERDAVAEVRREYSPERPPKLRGYMLAEAYGTPFGYMYFRYVRELGGAGKIPPSEKSKHGGGGPPCRSL